MYGNQITAYLIVRYSISTELIYYSYRMGSVRFFNVFKRSLLRSPNLQLFDQKKKKYS